MMKPIQKQFFLQLKALLLSISLLAGLNAAGQIIRPKPLFKEPTPTSPQSAALIKSIEFPVDYARGLVNVEIPLYTVKVNDIEIPIALKYHSSGIKVHDMSGWVGLGWSLSAEPAITRSIQGRADERNFLNNELLGNNTKEYLEDLANNVNDELPDQFYYSLTGSSGSFLFSRKPGISGWNIKTLPYQPLKIEPLGANPSQLNSFKITDDSGRQFYFGGSHVERTDLLDLTTWKGNEIISANRMDTVRFAYHPTVNEWVPKPQSHYVSVDDQPTNYHDEIVRATNCADGSTSTAPDEQMPKPFVSEYVNGAIKRYYWNVSTQSLDYLETIDGPSTPSVEATEVLYTKNIFFRGGRVEFEIGNRQALNGSTIYDNSKRLNKILVYDSQNKVVKEIRLTYEEFNSHGNVPNNNSVSIYQSRMLLSSVETFANNVTIGEKHEFTYNRNGTLPNKFSYDLDLWGYYNGPKNNASLIPSTTLEARTYTNAAVPLTVGGADRTSDSYYNYGQAAILMSVKYPTGGTTAFEYEPNKALNVQTQQNTVVGGFRIRKITDYDAATGASKVRSFLYGSAENGGGYMRHWVSGDALYNPFMIEQTKLSLVRGLVTCFGIPGPGVTYGPISINTRLRTVMSNPVANLFYNGEVVAYPEVSEYNGEAYQINSGKIVHKYFFTGLGSLGGYETPFFVNGTTLPYETKADWIYGTQTNKAIYKSPGLNSYVAIQENGSSYFPALDSDKIWSRSVYRNTVVIDHYGGSGIAIQPYFYQTQINEYQTGYNQLLSDTSNIQESGFPLFKKINNYVYGNPKLTVPTEVSFLNSSGRLIKEKSLFPAEMVAMGNSQPYQEMIDRNMLNVPVAVEKYSDQNFLNRTTTHYGTWPAGLIAPTNIALKKGAFAEDVQVEFKGYDARGNLSGFSKQQGPNTVYLYSYNSQHLIAEISNATTAMVESVFGGAGAIAGIAESMPTDAQLTAWINQLRASPTLGQSHIKSYSYKPLVGMTSMTDAKGLTSYYHYDPFNRLRYVKDQDGNILQAYCYNYAGQVVDCTSEPVGQEPVGTCQSFRLRIPFSVLNNLYVSYRPCGSSMYVTVGAHELEQELGEGDEVVLTICKEGSAPDFQFRYGPNGAGQMINSIQINPVGPCQ
ncbi:hypothetical protein EA772_01285 [Pedobacter sp. G11]|uniref:hypothetical protein n=1 Tax=Pedobacter sp. G11 TaxID=2482728 RepID=UPI000F60152A|nr:hypothetical protein [Pedobacter sp. G11]AZI24041.1 hypothetical protein EA772_01285 [Pedobacter sp. G11]